jgi:flagellin-specific chaperone FliS
LTEHFTHLSRISVEDLVEGFVKDGFLPIFDGSATIEEIHYFLFNSDFGCVLQGLRQEFKEFPERLRNECLMKYKEEVEKGKVENLTPVEDLLKERLKAHLDSILENDFIMNFKRIFEFLLEKLGNRDDLTPEIREILHFLKQLVEFLNPV